MKAAIFDIDGVLTKGFVIRHFWAYLAEKEIINAHPLLSSERAFEKFIKKQKSYREMARESMKHVAMSFKGASQKEIRRMSKKFFCENKIFFFDYTIPLINLLKKKGFRIIAISGSNLEFIENYKRLLNLDSIYGTEFQVLNGKYNGGIKINMALSESKESTIKKLSNIDKIIGFGDSKEDVSILESVKIPVAVNPQPDLELIASRKSWEILNENDNIVERIRELIS